MIASLAIIWALVLMLGFIALRRSTDTVRRAAQIGLNQGRTLVLRMPLAMLIGGFMVELIPQEALQGVILSLIHI